MSCLAIGIAPEQTANRKLIRASDPQQLSLALSKRFLRHFQPRQRVMYNIFLPALMLLIAAFYQSNARVLSTSSPTTKKSPDTLAERDWISDAESIFIAKDGEGCLNPVQSSKSKREDANSLYYFNQFFDKSNPGADSNSDSNHFSPLLFDKTNTGATGNSDLNNPSPLLANDVSTLEGNTVTTLASVDSGFLGLESARNSPLSGYSLEGSSAAFFNSIPGSTSNDPSSVQRDTADIAGYVPWIICVISN